MPGALKSQWATLRNKRRLAGACASFGKLSYFAYYKKKMFRLQLLSIAKKGTNGIVYTSNASIVPAFSCWYIGCCFSLIKPKRRNFLYELQKNVDGRCPMTPSFAECAEPLYRFRPNRLAWERPRNPKNNPPKRRRRTLQAVQVPLRRNIAGRPLHPAPRLILIIPIGI